MAELAVAEKQVIAVQNIGYVSSTTSKKDIPVYGSYDDHIFNDRVTAEYWREVYENAKYEGRHRFDPTYTWTAEEEKKLVRKVRVLGCLEKGPSNTFVAGSSYYALGVAHVLLP